jgi:hypothetical protein
MLILLPSPKGLTLHHWLPQMQTVNGVYYVNILKIQLRNLIRNINGVLDKTVFLLQDNACDDKGTLYTTVEHLILQHHFGAFPMLIH